MTRYIFFFLLSILTQHAALATDVHVELNHEERLYIKNNPILRVSVATDWPPFNYIDQEKESGYVNDYMRLLAQRAGLKLGFVRGKTWPEYMEMLANNELDCITNMTITENRKERFLFSRDPVVDVFNGLLVRKNELQPSNIEAFRNRVIAVARGYSQQELLATYYPDIELLPTENLLVAIREVIAGRADAAVGAHAVFSYYLSKYLLTEVKSTPLATSDLFPSAPHYIAIHPQNKVLHSLLDKAAATITRQEIQQLQDQWYITFAKEEKIHFSEAERLYLKNKKALSICVDPNWMPIEKIENGEHVGISAEYMKLFSEKIGTPITLYPTESWEETVEAAQRRKCDFISMAISTPDRRKHFLFSRPYFTSPLVMATKSNSAFLPGVTAAKGELVGVTEGYAFVDDLSRKYPNIHFTPVKSLDKGLSMVRDGKLFGYVDSMLSLAYTIQKKYPGELKIATEANLRLELNMAIRNDQPELLGIFNKAILSLDNSDHQQILNKWISVKYEEVANYRLLLQILAGAALLFGVLLYRHYVLRKLNQKLQFQNLEIRKSSEALKSTQQQLLMTQHAIDSCAFPIFWISLEKETQVARVVHANIQAAKTLGYSLDEFMALSVDEIIEGEASDSPLLFNDDRNERCGNSSISRFKRKDGTSLPVEQYISSFNYADIYCNFVFFQDISERLEMEARLHRSMKMETIGMMAGGVAHDLNNILSGVVSYPELVLMKLPKESEVYGYVETIHQSGIKAASIVADLLTVARGATAVLKNIQINTLIQEYVSSPEFKKLETSHQGVNLELHLDPDLDNVLCSPIHISKSVMNLVTNAFEVSKPGQSIILSTFTSEQPPKILQPRRYVVISVEDFGGGIPEEFLPHIFEPFYTKKTMGQSGTGLGLTIVWNSAQDHGGGVFAENTKDGSRFSFYLPATTTTTATQVEEKIPVNNLQGNGEKILVIDDELQQLNVAQHMLEVLGYHGTYTNSGETGVERALKETFDLILIDMIMPPGIGGLETYKKIVSKRKSQRAIIVSGYADETEVKKMMALGVSQFVKKPYSLNDLAIAIKKELTES